MCHRGKLPPLTSEERWEESTQKNAFADVDRNMKSRFKDADIDAALSCWPRHTMPC